MSVSVILPIIDPVGAVKPGHASEALPLPPAITATVPAPTLGVHKVKMLEAPAIPEEPTSMARNRAVVRKVELNICYLSKETGKKIAFFLCCLVRGRTVSWVIKINP